MFEETGQEKSEEQELHQTAVETDNETLSPKLAADGASFAEEASAVVENSSLDEGKCDSPRKHREKKGRDRSNTWSHTHTALTFKTSEIILSFLIVSFLLLARLFFIVHILVVVD